MANPLVDMRRSYQQIDNIGPELKRQKLAMQQMQGQIDAQALQIRLLIERVEALEAGDTLAVADTANPTTDPPRRGPGRPRKDAA